jgi:hypothetical protein
VQSCPNRSCLSHCRCEARALVGVVSMGPVYRIVVAKMFVSLLPLVTMTIFFFRASTRALAQRVEPLMCRAVSSPTSSAGCSYPGHLDALHNPHKETAHWPTTPTRALARTAVKRNRLLSSNLISLTLFLLTLSHCLHSKSLSTHQASSQFWRALIRPSTPTRALARSMEPSRWVTL